ncbi:MAG TPA: inositol monophosphatase family protein, partial [Thiohalobacter sp.]|nr:inositol monophosphatase family protein [Thiohalobacter sp.]
DGFWELKLNPWDLAAGVLLIQEAGGIVGDFTGGHKFMQSGNVVAGNPKVFAAIVKKLRPHLTPEMGS